MKSFLKEVFSDSVNIVYFIVALGIFIAEMIILFRVIFEK